jgi:hypothetical protein
MGLIRNLYEHLDSQIMNHVNAGVRAWNWTTGRKKSDLASGLAYTNPILITIGGISYEDPLLPLSIGIYCGLSLLCSKLWKKQEDLEISASKKQMVDPRAESIKSTSEHIGVSSGTIALIQTSLPFYMSAYLSLSAACYVSRADSLPPRKDCIRRGLDKLVEAYRAKRAEEQVVPSPA